MASARICKATVVIPTRDRPEDLRRCLQALARQVDAPPFEVVVVDDGSQTPVASLVSSIDPGFRTVRLEGGGPALARNAGARDAGEILLFTDDDTEVAPTWVAAACDHLDTHPQDLGVEGPVRTPPWDPLTGYSVYSDGPGAYLTCNVAYRREPFIAEGGFYPGFRHASGEDHDLAYRMLRRGRIGFAEAMAIVHHPRALSFRGVIRRGLHAESDMLLYARHPDRFPPDKYPVWLRSPCYDVKRWVRYWRSAEHGVDGSLRRRARMLVTAVAYVAYTVIGTVIGVRARRRLNRT